MATRKNKKKKKLRAKKSLSSYASRRRMRRLEPSKQKPKSRIYLPSFNWQRPDSFISLQRLVENGHPPYFGISRQEIETLDFSLIHNLMPHIHFLRGRVYLKLNGYNLGMQPPCHVPEFVRWSQELKTHFPLSTHLHAPDCPLHLMIITSVCGQFTIHDGPTMRLEQAKIDHLISQAHISTLYEASLFQFNTLQEVALANYQMALNFFRQIKYVEKVDEYMQKREEIINTNIRLFLKANNLANFDKKATLPDVHFVT